MIRGSGKQRFMALAFSICAAVFSQSASAAVGSASGTIQSLYTYGDGRILVRGLTFSTGTCSSNTGFTVAADHPNFARILATLLTARAMGLTITVVAKVDNCWYPEITTDSTTYVILES